MANQPPPATLPPAPAAKPPFWRRPSLWLTLFVFLCVICAACRSINGLLQAPANDTAAVEDTAPQETAATATSPSLAAASPEADAPTEVPEEPSPTLEPSATPEPTVTPEPTATIEPTPVPEPITFTGSGNGVTDNFTTTGDLLIVEATHQGSSNLIAQLNNASTAELEDIAVNMIGTGTTAMVVDAEPGEHYLEVLADGPWTITIKYAFHLDTQTEGPYTFSGDGNTVTPVFLLNDGRADFTMSHQGDSNFIVLIYNLTNQTLGDIVGNEIGTVADVRSTAAARAGPHLLGIMADGPWTITVSQP